MANCCGQYRALQDDLERKADADPSPAKPKAPPIAAPEITLDDVALNYGDLPVLRGTSFTAAAGKTTALVGASGAGKSTIFNVLTRLVEPASGSVAIDGTANTRICPCPTCAGCFPSCPKMPPCSTKPCATTSCWAARTSAMTDLAHVLDAAHVSDFLAQMPDGLDSPAGPRGSNLSGGQRQRIAIARALAARHADPAVGRGHKRAGHQIRGHRATALEALSNGRTTLVIAHRLSTVRNAHSIVVMDHGRVVDQGDA